MTFRSWLSKNCKEFASFGHLFQCPLSNNLLNCHTVFLVAVCLYSHHLVWNVSLFHINVVNRLVSVHLSFADDDLSFS
jgi:hypothetical protein